MNDAPVHTLREYQTLFIPDVQLTWRDDRVLQRLGAASEDDRRQLDVSALPGGVEVRSSYWVGVARFEQFEVHVQPKLIGSEDVLVDMIGFATDAYTLRRFDALRTYSTEQDSSLLELFAILLADACETLVRQGLLADYVEREDMLPAVRGRILIDQQVLKRFGVFDRIYCRYDEREHNVVENQLLLHALEATYRLIHRPFLRARIRRLVRTFQSFCDLDRYNPDEARRLHYHRLNERYRNAHGLAWVILDASGLETFYDSGKTRGFSFFINMNTLFERFVEKLLKAMFPRTDYFVSTQFSDGSIIQHARTGETYREIRPDALLTNNSNGRQLPIDAKYKLYDDKKIATADVYQLQFYANAYNRGDDPSGVLIFPTTDGHRVDHLAIRDARRHVIGNLVALGIDVDELLTNFRSSYSVDPQQLTAAFSMADPHVVPPPPPEPPETSLNDLLELCVFPEEQALLQRCADGELPLPEIGYPIRHGSAVAGELVFAWIDLKLGVATTPEDSKAAESIGWTTTSIDDAIALLQRTLRENGT